MKISEAFPSRFLSAADLDGAAVRVVIADCTPEELDEHEQPKPVLRFQGRQKGLVLNRTNANVLVEAWGDETDDWRGREVELYPARVQFGTRLVDAIRLRVPPPPGAEPKAARW